jgi:hypothetical protein
LRQDSLSRLCLDSVLPSELAASTCKVTVTTVQINQYCPSSWYIFLVLALSCRKGVDGIASGIENLVRVIRQRIKIVFSRSIKNARQYLTPLFWYSGCAAHIVLPPFLPDLSSPTG